MNGKPEPWVTLEAVAEHLGVSTDTVHRWLRRRGLPGHKAGHFWKFKFSEVDAWVRSGKTGSARELGGTQASGG